MNSVDFFGRLPVKILHRVPLWNYTTNCLLLLEPQVRYIQIEDQDFHQHRWENTVLALRQKQLTWPSDSSEQGFFNPETTWWTSELYKVESDSRTHQKVGEGRQKSIRQIHTSLHNIHKLLVFIICLPTTSLF